MGLCSEILDALDETKDYKSVKQGRAFYDRAPRFNSVDLVMALVNFTEWIGEFNTVMDV